MSVAAKKAMAYKLLICGAGLLLFVISLIRGDFDNGEFLAVALFGFLAIFAETMTVSLPRGGYLSVGFALEYAMLILYGPTLTVFVVLLGGLVGKFKIARENPLRFAFNIAQFSLSLYAAGAVYRLLGEQYGKIDLMNPVPLALAALTYFFINSTAVTVAISLDRGLRPLGLWATNIRWSIPNMLALAPMGLLMAYLYQAHFLMVLLFFIPLLVARYSFKLYMDMRQVHLDTIHALVDAIDAKDKYTRGHSERVARISVALGRQMDLSEEQMEHLEYAAVLHDIGKIGVSEDILNKPGRLTDDEYDRIKEHPSVGAGIVASMESFEGLGQIIRHHHERIDGKGYPDGISGEEIPLLARIIAVADTYDAMTSERPYRPPMEKGQAILEIARVAGDQLDVGVVTVFLQLVAEEKEEGHPLTILEAAVAED